MEHQPVLLVTGPSDDAAKSLFELWKDEEIATTFGMKLNSVEDTQTFLKNQTDCIGGVLTFFRLIKIGFSQDPKFHDAANTILIGFISVHNTGGSDWLFNGGLNQNLSFALSSEYRNRGIMTIALKMTLDAMKQKRYNFISSLVKQGNLVSEKLLLKCGFDKVHTTSVGSVFTKRLDMSENEYDKLILQ